MFIALYKFFVALILFGIGNAPYSFKNLPIKAFDIVEVSPKLDVNDITSWLALKTIYEVFDVLVKKEKV